MFRSVWWNVPQCLSVCFCLQIYCQLPCKPRTSVRCSLTPDEIQNVEVRIIRDTQRTDVYEEFSAIQGSRAFSKKSRLLKLTPKVDHDGLLRCDGRLQYAEYLPYDVRFPIILPRGNWTTKLTVKFFHEAGHHVTGTNHTLQISRPSTG